MLTLRGSLRLRSNTGTAAIYFRAVFELPFLLPRRPSLPRQPARVIDCAAATIQRRASRKADGSRFYMNTDTWRELTRDLFRQLRAAWLSAATRASCCESDPTIALLRQRWSWSSFPTITGGGQRFVHRGAAAGGEVSGLRGQRPCSRWSFSSGAISELEDVGFFGAKDSASERCLLFLRL